MDYKDSEDYKDYEYYLFEKPRQNRMKDAMSKIDLVFLFEISMVIIAVSVMFGGMFYLCKEVTDYSNIVVTELRYLEINDKVISSLELVITNKEELTVDNCDKALDLIFAESMFLETKINEIKDNAYEIEITIDDGKKSMVLQIYAKEEFGKMNFFNIK